jgi:predicted SprT family Zn-dependent metalloprotease
MVEQDMSTGASNMKKPAKKLYRTIQPTPTAETYGSFNDAFAFFNGALFDHQLPNVLITMQRSKRSRGYFASERFVHRANLEKKEDEIALNPRTFMDRTDREIISTLVHEMVHLWQFHFGKPGRRGYHNKQWAAKMREVGLVPSHTGEPGGKQTGQSVTHYIQENGSYNTNWKRLVEAGFALNYQDQFGGRPVDPKKDRHCYACECSKVWGKPDMRNLFCKTCQTDMR